MLHLTLAACLLSSCQPESKVTPSSSAAAPSHREPAVHTGPTQFIHLDASRTGIDFINKVDQDLSMNIHVYPYLFNGSGLGVADFNNDGLEDIFFAGALEESRLYLNKGDFKFEDITKTSGISSPASSVRTGVAIVDINNDGWKDIYVCIGGALQNDAARKNQLFLNNGDLTFTEVAEDWGLDFDGHSTQAYFFDYDRDGDLDMYLANYPPEFRTNTRIYQKPQTDFNAQWSDHLYRNDGQRYTQVTEQAGLLNKTWALSASLGDFNQDGWTDIYVANDFLAPDALYINQGDGTFRDEILSTFDHIPMFSMGSDFADLNNDGHNELMVLDMLPEDYQRKKVNLQELSFSNFNTMVNFGYHHQYSSNSLQYNHGDGRFSEIGQLLGIEKTDWSWGTLMADFDGDGYKDIFIANGILGDMSDLDFRDSISNLSGKSVDLEAFLQLIKRERIANYYFKNMGGMTFEKRTVQAGLDRPSDSNGSAYVDLNNDGALDLVVNNLGDAPLIYENTTQSNYIKIQLIGDQNNKMAIGSRVILYAGGQRQYLDQYLQRGFMSSSTSTLNFGIGSNEQADSVIIIWPDGKTTLLGAIPANQVVKAAYTSSDRSASKPETSMSKNNWFTTIPSDKMGIDYTHRESEFVDFALQRLLPHEFSHDAPPVAIADFDGNGTEDFFIGNGQNLSPQVFLQNKNGQFSATTSDGFSSIASKKQLGVLDFDMDSDGDQDLLISSGGYQAYQPGAVDVSLFENDGKGGFTTVSALPKLNTNSKTMLAISSDNQKNPDVILFGHIQPGRYPYASQSYYLTWNGSKYIDATSSHLPDQGQLGIVNDAILADVDGDGRDEIVYVGDAQAVQYLDQEGEKYLKKSLTGDEVRGFHYRITSFDLNADGQMDYVIGNLGGNNRYEVSPDDPLFLFAKDFDQNNSLDIVLSKKIDGEFKPLKGKDYSIDQNIFIKKKYQHHYKFAAANLEEIYGDAINNAVKVQYEEFRSFALISDGKGGFTTEFLPAYAQFGPTTSAAVVDIDGDNTRELIGVGALLRTDVETPMYDANKGYVLDGGEEVKATIQLGDLNAHGVQGIHRIMIGGQQHVMTSGVDLPLTFYRLNK